MPIAALLLTVGLITPPLPAPPTTAPAAATSIHFATRRHALLAAAAVALVPVSAPQPAYAALSTLADAQYSYSLSYPHDWSEAGKPVKTHLHEVLLSAPSSPARMKLGVTVDPVKINSLAEFGTLDFVTKKVLGVEETRDGVKSVTLRANAAEDGDAELKRPSYYTIEYATVSSRGTKMFLCKYCICNGKLYVLQAQANLDAFDAEAEVRDALRGVVGSFQVQAS